MAISLKTDNFIYPYFVINGVNKKKEIKSFPGQFCFSLDRLIEDIGQSRKLRLNKFILFGVPEKKDTLGTQAYKEGNLVSLAVKQIKAEFPEAIVITDVCLCAYTSDGHCGAVKQEGKGGLVVIDNKRTLNLLSKVALTHAQSGADWVAPSAMAKGQVLAIRQALDSNGYSGTKILGYSAKFASNFYGPFRNAANSAPKFGDRSGYQLDYADESAAITEIKEDIKEGADMVMVKPALSYLDLIRQAKDKFKVSLAAYNVSGEYAFVKYGAKQGLWDERKMVFEILTSIKRAGADFIITYHAKDVAKWLKV